jgi:hypothetical protein
MRNDCDPRAAAAAAAAELRSAWTAEGGCPYANPDGRGRPSPHEQKMKMSWGSY